MSIIVGIIKVMARFTNRLARVRSLLASSNRSSSCFSVPKARMTESPVRISLLTRFSRSTKFCRIRNFGITTANSTATNRKISTTARAMIHDISTFVWNTFQMPPIAMMGAYSTIRRIITVSSWICWISLVLLVIRDAVENLSNSPFENPTTFRKTLSLKLRPSPAPTREAMRPTRILAAIPSPASRSIFPPVARIYRELISPTSIPIFS